MKKEPVLPELPEVETIRRQIEPLIVGKVISHVQIADPRVAAPVTPQALAGKLEGKRIEAVTRRGKYLRLELNGGDILVIHLRMTGVLTHVTGNAVKNEWPHLRLVIGFTAGGSLVFQDQRRFGTALVLPASEAESYFSRLGPEPLEKSFGSSRLESLLGARKRPIKSLLLDQTIIAGIGNIYADEALFRAGIHPLREAGSLTTGEVKRLSRAIKTTLRRAIDLQGSSIDTYRDSEGSKGRFQDTFRVHRREGEPCPGCRGTVEKIKVGGRGTYFCPACQR